VAVTALEKALSRLAREGSSTSGSLRTASTAMRAATAASSFPAGASTADGDYARECLSYHVGHHSAQLRVAVGACPACRCADDGRRSFSVRLSSRIRTRCCSVQRRIGSCAR
jgi:hypothetical protein